MKVLLKYIYIIVFIILISWIGITTILNYDTLDLNTFKKFEKRNPATLPKWNWEKDTISNYFSKLDLYVNDAFSFRNKLISLYSLVHYKIGVSMKPDKVVFGSNDFLFLGNYHNKIIDQTKGKNLFTNNELQTWLNNFLVRKRYLDQFDIPLYLIIAPNKHSIYPEYLPDYITPSKNNRHKQVTGLSPEFTIINLKDTLLASKLIWSDKLYNKTDSHWSVIGAYIAYLKIMQQLMPDFKKLNVLELINGDFNIEPSNSNAGLKHQLHIKTHMKDFSVRIEKNKEWTNDLIKINFSGDTLPYNYLQNIRVREQCIIVNKHKPYTVLLLKDSFSERLSVYLNQTFGKTIYCHYNQFEGIELTQLVEKYKPDIVLYEFVERMLIVKQEVHSNIVFNNVRDNFIPICKMNGEYLYKNLTPKKHITDIQLVKNEYSFNSVGSDPILILPKVKTQPNKHIALKLDFNSPKKSSCQIFYKTVNNKHYNKQNSISLTTESGRNQIFILLPEKSIEGELRFDPGLVPGKYRIHSIEFLEEK